VEDSWLLHGATPEQEVVVQFEVLSMKTFSWLGLVLRVAQVSRVSLRS
jgi:hypothetical protein